MTSIPGFITSYIADHATAVDVLVSTFALITLFIVRKYMKPLKEQLTATTSSLRIGDGDPTIKDIMIENYRETYRIRQKQEDYDKNQKAITEVVGGIQKEVHLLNHKLENHINETEPLMLEIKNHLKNDPGVR